MKTFVRLASLSLALLSLAACTSTADGGSDGGGGGAGGDGGSGTGGSGGSNPGSSGVLVDLVLRGQDEASGEIATPVLLDFATGCFFTELSDPDNALVPHLEVDFATNTGEPSARVWLTNVTDVGEYVTAQEASDPNNEWADSRVYINTTAHGNLAAGPGRCGASCTVSILDGDIFTKVPGQTGSVSGVVTCTALNSPMSNSSDQQHCATTTTPEITTWQFDYVDCVVE